MLYSPSGEFRSSKYTAAKSALPSRRGYFFILYKSCDGFDPGWNFGLPEMWHFPKGPAVDAKKSAASAREEVHIHGNQPHNNVA